MQISGTNKARNPILFHEKVSSLHIQFPANKTFDIQISVLITQQLDWKLATNGKPLNSVLGKLPTDFSNSTCEIVNRVRYWRKSR